MTVLPSIAVGFLLARLTVLAVRWLAARARRSRLDPVNYPKEG